MKILLSIIVVSLILNSPVQAQFQQPGSGQVAAANEQLNKELRNQAQVNYLFGNYLMGVAIENSLKRQLGAERIRKGLATSRILMTAKNSLIGQQQNQNQPFLIAKLEAFHDLMRKKRLTPNDWADNLALAFVLSYQIYFGEEPGDARMNKLRSDHRLKILKDQLWQGTPDDERQPRYENMAIRTMTAVSLFELAQQPGVTAGNKRAAQEKAKSIAEQILDDQWSGPVAKLILTDPRTSLGFADKGDQVISKGGSRTDFVRSNQVLTAAEFNTQDNNRKGTAYYEKLLRQFDESVRSRGGKTNDMAWVNAVAFALVYEIHPKIRVRLNAQQINWLLKEMQSDVLNDGSFQALSDEEKQTYYERLAIRAMKIVDSYQTGEWSKSGDWLGDDIARTLLRDVFNPRNLSDYKLTPAGFVKNK